MILYYLFSLLHNARCFLRHRLWPADVVIKSILARREMVCVWIALARAINGLWQWNKHAGGYRLPLAHVTVPRGWNLSTSDTVCATSNSYAPCQLVGFSNHERSRSLNISQSTRVEMNARRGALIFGFCWEADKRFGGFNYWQQNRRTVDPRRFSSFLPWKQHPDQTLPRRISFMKCKFSACTAKKKWHEL